VLGEPMTFPWVIPRGECLEIPRVQCTIWEWRLLQLGTTRGQSIENKTAKSTRIFSDAPCAAHDTWGEGVLFRMPAVHEPGPGRILRHLRHVSGPWRRHCPPGHCCPRQAAPDPAGGVQVSLCSTPHFFSSPCSPLPPFPPSLYLFASIGFLGIAYIQAE
jgi:hypothetical protein